MEEIRDLIASYERCWSARDFGALSALFADDDQLIYKAEEVAEPIIGHVALQQYFAECNAVIERCEVMAGHVSIRPLSPDVFLLFFPMQWWIASKSDPAHPISGDVHVTAIAQQGSPHLQFIHYAEAPLGALPFLRSVYRARGFSKPSRDTSGGG